MEALLFTCCGVPHLAQCACPTCGRPIREGNFAPLPANLQEAYRAAWDRK